MTMAWLLAVTLLAPAGAREPSVYPVLDRDPMLRKEVTLSRTPETLGALLEAVSRKAGIQLVCQGDYLDDKVLFRVNDQEVREVMTQVALTTKGFWVKRKGAYLLLARDNQELAHLFQGGASTAREHEWTRRMIDSFTPAQLTRLRSGSPLTLKDLSGQQINWFVSAWNQEYFMNPQRYHRDTFNSKAGGLITLDPQGMVVMWMPQVDEQGKIEKQPTPFLRMSLQPSG